MKRTKRLSFFYTASLLASLGIFIKFLGGFGSSNASPAPPPIIAKINHVVVIFQENRTPDNLFHGLPNADIADSGLNSAGDTISLTPEPLATNYDLDHSHAAFLKMYDHGKMDGADKVAVVCSANATDCPPTDPQFKFVVPSDVKPYMQLAKEYAFADRMFQTNQGPSFPAHQFIIAGTSAPSASSNLFAAENTVGGTGCTAPLTAFVRLIGPLGSEQFKAYPCFDHPTLMDELDAHGIDWRYYAPSAPLYAIWNAPESIQHLRSGADWANVILSPKQVLLDIANNQMAQVTWVMPTGQESDHPGVTDGSGPAWVASIVNAIGNSPYWPDTAIFITWDDWGGWYDHVAPRIYNSYEYGFRVPLIVVSPYAKHGYVSHVTHDFGSILKFIEEVYGLPSLGYADARADDLRDCFDFYQMSPMPFTSIPTQFQAAYFLNDTSPPLPPDDD
ncbi:MAG TPA: alkaline phosphatase family protein [Terriglobia bacterium]|nr:alkaline phosphatase family protein [Terriglobia bacterium]